MRRTGSGNGARRAVTVLGLALVPLATATPACAPRSLVLSDSFADWCDGAPCGWELRSGTVAPTTDGAVLGGAAAATLRREAPITLDFAPDDLFPGFLVVRSAGDVLLEVAWNDGTVDQLLLNFRESTYLYLQLAPPRTADRFVVSLSTSAGEASRIDLVAVTRCSPPAGDRRVAIDSALEGDRLLFWYYVEEQYYDHFGHECPRGGGGLDDEGAAAAGGE